MPGKIILYYNDLVYSPSESFLGKDFGQVPYVLSELYDCELQYMIAASNPNLEFVSFRGKNVVQYAKSLRWIPARLDVFSNYRLYADVACMTDLDYLVVFPFTPLTDFMVVRSAKRGNPLAKIILKLDANIEFLAKAEQDWARVIARKNNLFKQVSYYRKLLQIADIVICETSATYEMLSAKYMGLTLSDKLVKTFNGVSEGWLCSLGVDPSVNAGRHSAIIVSGRLSEYVKNTALILDAGPPPPGWTIEFVGEIDGTLEAEIDRHRAKNPDFDCQYRFHGLVTDKRRYFDILCRGRALLMNSRGPEGFPNVYADAHFARLFIVTSDIASAVDATGGGRWGSIYARDSVEALRQALAELPDRVEKYEADDTVEVYRRNFIWEHSLDQPAIRRVFGSDVPN